MLSKSPRRLNYHFVTSSMTNNEVAFHIDRIFTIAGMLLWGLLPQTTASHIAHAQRCACSYPIEKVTCTHASQYVDINFA